MASISSRRASSRLAPSSPTHPVPRTYSDRISFPSRKTRYLQLLFRHPFEHPAGRNRLTYDAFETYGDAVLQLLTTAFLAQKYTNLSKAGMTDMRKGLVRNTTLAVISRIYGMPTRLVAGSGQEASLKQTESVAANLFEAYLWAVYVQHGHEVAATWIDGVYANLAEVLYKELRALHSRSYALI